MDAKAQATPQRSYQDFQPSSNWVREEGYDTLVVHLPGFRKDQLRIQIDKIGKLKVSGECPLADDNWSRFCKDFRIPKNSNLNEIQAKFEGGVVYIIMPKTITRVTTQDQVRPTQESPANPKAENGKTSENSQEHVTAGVNGAQQKKDNLDNLTGDAEKDMNATNEKHGGSESVSPGKIIESMEKEAPLCHKQPSYKFGACSLILRSVNPGQLVNFAVAAVLAIAVVVALRVYATYKLGSSREVEY